jgi:hypothetical protein
MKFAFPVNHHNTLTGGDCPMSEKGKVVRVTYSEENSRETDLWMYRIIERIVLQQLNIHPAIKAELLRGNQNRISKIISGGSLDE